MCIAHDFRAEQALGGALAHSPVTLELFFLKDLIQNSFMRKAGVAVPVIQHVLRLRSGDRGLQIDHPSNLFGLRFVWAVKYLNKNGVGTAYPFLVRLKVREVVFEFDAKIDQGIAFETLQIAAFGSQVGAAMHADDELTPTPQKLVNAEILNMSAVGNVEILHVFLNPARDFRQEICRADTASRPFVQMPDAGKPVAKPHIENRHEETKIWQRPPSHVRGCGGAGDCHRSPKINMRIAAFDKRSVHVTADRGSAEEGAQDEEVAVSPTKLGVRARGEVHNGIEQVIRCCTRAAHSSERQPLTYADPFNRSLGCFRHIAFIS